MLFLAFGQWSPPMPWISFAVFKRKSMKTKQAVAIIGAEESRGAALAARLSEGNNRVLLWSGDRDKMNATVQQIRALHANADVEALDCSVDACWEADLIIAALPLPAGLDKMEMIREVANRKTVICLQCGNGTSSAEALQEMLPYSQVVGLWVDEDGSAVLSGKDEEALQSADDLLSEAGFRVLSGRSLS
jgi:glycerol-3-phosphate dehydrogenase